MPWVDIVDIKDRNLCAVSTGAILARFSNTAGAALGGTLSPFSRVDYDEFKLSRRPENP
jgi:hypothetical protein